MSQFEREIKNVLENYEMPMDNEAWSGMEKKMNAGNRSSFYKQFIVAGVVLTSAFGVLTSDFGSNGNSHNQLAEGNNMEMIDSNHLDKTSSDNLHATDNSKMNNSEANSGGENDAIHSNNFHSDELYDNSNKVISEHIDIANPEGIESTGTLNTTSIDRNDLDNLTMEEKNNLIMINEKIDQKSNNNLVTEYVGKNFNLNANVILTPNGDNIQDVFLPEAIKEGDDFLMKIFNQDDVMIFSTSNVNNPWKGYNQVTGSMSEEGNYRWKVILDKDNRKEIFTGIIMVK